MTARASSGADRVASRTLLALLGTTAVVGAAELSTIGLLPTITTSLGISVAAAGALFALYTVGMAVGGPLLAAATLRSDRRQVLVVSTILLAVATALPALFPQFAVFVAARLIAGALQGLILAAAMTTAVSVVPPTRSGHAVSVVVAGFAVASVAGMPLTVLAGSILGWRGALVLIGMVGLAGSLILVAVLPSLPTGPHSDAGSSLRSVLQPRVVAALALTVALFAAPGAVMTYLMPVLAEFVGTSAVSAGAVVMAYGLVGVGGSFLGGRMADVHSARGLVVVTIGLAAAGLTVLTLRSTPLAALIAILAWSVFTSAAPPLAQHRVMSLAPSGGDLGASLPASAAGAGLAIGATVGGQAHAIGGAAAVVAAGVALAGVACALALATRTLRPVTGQPSPISSASGPTLETRPGRSPS